MKKNRGSMVIEMTLLMPVFLGCVYLYVMLFVSLIHTQQKMEQAAEVLYAVDATGHMTDGIGGKDSGNQETGSNGGAMEGLSYLVKGDRRKISFQEGGWFQLHFQMEAGQKNPAKKLRRWQLLADIL